MLQESTGFFERSVLISTMVRSLSLTQCNICAYSTGVSYNPHIVMLAAKGWGQDCIHGNCDASKMRFKTSSFKTGLLGPGYVGVSACPFFCLMFVSHRVPPL